MEMATLMRLTKNAFYRSMLIFKRIQASEPRILAGKKLNNYICGCMSIGAKFENSSRVYFEDILSTNGRKVEKEDISWAEFNILEVHFLPLRSSSGRCRCWCWWSRKSRIWRLGSKS